MHVPTVGRFLLPMTGLRPEALCLALGRLDVFAFFGATVLPLNLGYVVVLEELSLVVGVFLVVVVLFVVDVLRTLFLDGADSSALTSATVSSISLAASCWSILDAANNIATERIKEKDLRIIRNLT